MKCKDCLYYNDHTYAVTWCDMNDRVVTEKDYCSWGERIKK